MCASSLCRQRLEPTPGATAQGLSEAFDADVVGRTLLLRRWQRGDRMQPLGMVGEKKVHDIMVDNRTPRALRHSIPLLVASDQVLWVVGARRSDVGKITRSDQNHPDRVVQAFHRCRSGFHTRRVWQAVRHVGYGNPTY